MATQKKVKVRLLSEHEEQVNFVSWFEAAFPLVRIFAVPNAARRSFALAKIMTQEGLKSGVPDLYVPEFKIWIEMKRSRGGVLSDQQKDWIAYLEKIGDCVIIGRGFIDAREQLLSVLRDMN